MVSHGKYDAAINTYIIALSPRCSMSFNGLHKKQKHNLHRICTDNKENSALGEMCQNNLM